MAFNEMNFSSDDRSSGRMIRLAAEENKESRTRSSGSLYAVQRVWRPAQP